MISSSETLPSRASSCWATSVDYCASAPFNSTVMKVVLLVTGLGFAGCGIYLTLTAPLMWNTYVIFGMSIMAFASAAILILSKMIKPNNSPSSTSDYSDRTVPSSRIDHQIQSTTAGLEPPHQDGSPSQNIASQTSIPSPSRTGPLVDFHISHLFNFSEFWDLTEFERTDFHPVPLVSPHSPQFIFDVFEQKKVPIIRGKDLKGNQSIFVRYLVYDKAGTWVEDNLICFVQVAGKWKVSTFASTLQDGLYLLEPYCGAHSEQTKWMQKLVKGERVPLTSFIFGHPTPSTEYICTLWDPSQKPVKSRLERIFGLRAYPNKNLPLLDSNDLFFYPSLPKHIAIYCHYPVFQGEMKHGENFYLLNLQCTLRNSQRLVQDWGYILIWYDSKHTKRWKVHFNLPTLPQQHPFMPKFSSDLLRDFDEKEIQALEDLVAGKSWVTEHCVLKLSS